MINLNIVIAAGWVPELIVDPDADGTILSLTRELADDSVVQVTFHYTHDDDGAWVLCWEHRHGFAEDADGVLVEAFIADGSTSVIHDGRHPFANQIVEALDEIVSDLRA